jgi:hypothetical protein
VIEVLLLDVCAPVVEFEAPPADTFLFEEVELPPVALLRLAELPEAVTPELLAELPEFFRLFAFDEATVLVLVFVFLFEEATVLDELPAFDTPDDVLFVLEFLLAELPEPATVPPVAVLLPEFFTPADDVPPVALLVPPAPPLAEAVPPAPPLAEAVPPAPPLALAVEVPPVPPFAVFLLPEVVLVGETVVVLSPPLVELLLVLPVALPELVLYPPLVDAEPPAPPLAFEVGLAVTEPPVAVADGVVVVVGVVVELPLLLLSLLCAYTAEADITARSASFVKFLFMFFSFSFGVNVAFN